MFVGRLKGSPLIGGDGLLPLAERHQQLAVRRILLDDVIKVAGQIDRVVGTDRNGVGQSKLSLAP